MNVKELRKAYVTLGLDEHATLSQARDAYLTWVCLLDHDRTPIAFVDPEAVPDLLHHELDLAWHAIEQAHHHGVLFPRQARGCQECTGTPAVRVQLHSVAPGGLRARTSTYAALLCRDCGLTAGRRIQRANLRRGWWGVLAPFANLHAIWRNTAELTFLRRVEAPTRRRANVRRTAPVARGRWYKRRERMDSLGFGMFAALAATALLVLGVVVPFSGGPDGSVSTTAAVSTAAK
jgi:hypothetical protein